MKEGRAISFDRMSEVCKGCGCKCDLCGGGMHSYLDLHQQIAELQGQLHRSNNHITTVEKELMESRTNMDLEFIRTKEDLTRLRDRYDRLLESHKKMQKLNHDLEDKLLKIVGKFESEKISLQYEVSSMMNKLVDARILINELDEENERYRTDCNMAVQLLQCKPSNFVAHKLTTLPVDLQERVKQHMTREQIIAAEKTENGQPEEQRLIRVPIATFPPTAMVYTLNQNANDQLQQQQQQQLQQQQHSNNPDSVSMSLIARVLSQKDPRRDLPRSFMCVGCKKDTHFLDKGCQVDLLSGVSRSVKITSLPHHDHSNQALIHSIGVREDSFGYNSLYKKREHCLSSSSTETEI